MAGFTLDEAYGQAPAPSGGFSLDDAYGKPSGPSEKDRLDAENRKQLLVDLWYGPGTTKTELPSLGGAAKEVGKSTAANVASIGDMIAGVPHQFASIFADLNTRLGQLVQGVPAKEVAKKAEEERNRVLGMSPTPFTSTLNAATGQPASPSGIETGMQNLMKWVDQKAQEVETATKGKVPKEDVNSVVNEVLGLYGVRGLGATAKGLTGKMQKGYEAQVNAPNPVADEAVAKINDGRGFELTPEEKDAVRARIEDFRQAREQGRVVPNRQRGALDWEAISDSAPLGSILEKQPNTLKTLERLPKARFEFSKEQLLQVLNQADISKAERDVVGPIAEAVPEGGKISAKELVQKTRAATGKFDLTPAETESYANYGLENIREPKWDTNSLRGDFAEGSLPPATTRLYRTPTVEVDPNSNHFHDPNLFGWTRSFEEGGVRHVVEVQSDLAQHAREMAPEARVKAEGELNQYRQGLNALHTMRDAITADGKLQGLNDFLSRFPAEAARLDPAGEYRRRLADPRTPPADTNFAMEQLRRRSLFLEAEYRGHVGDLQAALRTGDSAQTISPMLKHWPRRLVREELAQAAKNGETSVRFATPDTVAKVEGWPDGSTGGFRDLTDRRFLPEHQSIYNRYSDLTKFLKSQLGGKDYTDPQGHTWVEVPVTKEMRRPSQFGGVDAELLKRLGVAGAGAAIGAYLGGDDRAGWGAAMGGAIGLLGLRHAGGISKGADYGLGDLSSRIRNLSEPLLRRGRDYERLVREATHRDIVAVEPFLKRLHRMPKAPGKAVEAALKTGDQTQIRQAIAASNDPELQSSWTAVETAVANVDNALLAKGLLDLRKVQYFPVMRNAKGVPGAPEESLHTYLSPAHRTLEKARFFGRDLKLQGTRIDTGESIRALAKREEAAGRITPDGAEELRSMLYSRFGKGEIATNPMIQGLKNWAYAGLLANPVSAIAQIGDVANTAAQSGLRPTLAAVARKLTGQKRVGIKDFGLVDLNTEEFFNTPQSAKWLNRAMKASGFALMDTFGKDVTLGAALSKFERLAQTAKGQRQIAAKYQKMYEGDFPQLVADLKARRLTDLTRSMLFSELSDLQPISKLEVPQAYLDMPNGRVVFMLKTWALKQVDIVRREAYDEIKKGNVAKGLGNLAKWSLIFGLAGMGTSAIQDWLLGRKVKLDGEAFTENLFRTFGWSGYVTQKVKEGHARDAIASVALPPADMFAQILQADPKAVQYIPIAGKLIYNREMGGAEKADKAQAAAERRANRKKGKAPPL